MSHRVSLETLFCTLITDAHERHIVDTFDLPGAYLHVKILKYNSILIKIGEGFLDIMCQVNPEYKQHMIYENVKKVLYLLNLRAIYGCIDYALLWYKLFSTTLKGVGFEINPYDICVVNKTVEGTKCTIA